MKWNRMVIDIGMREKKLIVRNIIKYEMIVDIDDEFRV
jgi:hypothetical protein